MITLGVGNCSITKGQHRKAVPKVVVVEGMARDGNRELFYYGAADKYIAFAAAPAL